MVTVMVVGNGRFVDWLHAPVGNLADHVLELQRRVVNAKPLAQHLIDAIQNAIALRWRDVGNRHMTGQGVAVRTETPDVEVVNILYPVDRGQRGLDLAQRNAPWGAF